MGAADLSVGRCGGSRAQRHEFLKDIDPVRILVCTSQVPFARGGAELLSESLCQALRAHGHEAEIVALPYSWMPRSNLFNSALAWRLLELTNIDGLPVDA